MTTTIKTILRTYEFDIRDDAGRNAWNEFRAARLSEGSRPHGPVLSDVFHPFKALDGEEIELETKHLFDNQWNTVSGLRVFDFAIQSDSAPHAAPMSAPRNIRRGHYLEQTAEMTAIRLAVVKCGYCGKQHDAAEGKVFCDACLDSDYLTKDTLHLLRLMPASFNGTRGPLSPAEAADLEPRFTAAKIHGTTERGKARIAKERADIIAKADSVTRHAIQERDGFLWLMDRGLNTSNVIYYKHIGPGVFSFGWRTKLDKETADSLLDIMSEFPFEYQLDTDHRGKLGNFVK